MTFQMPNSRYVLPQFLEETSFGTKQIDPYGKLFEERIIFLGTQVDDTSAMARIFGEVFKANLLGRGYRREKLSRQPKSHLG